MIFFYLAGILRLSTKYFIRHLRTQAIRPSDSDMVIQLLRAPRRHGGSLPSNTPRNRKHGGHPYVHPIHVLNLAREVDVHIYRPFYPIFLIPVTHSTDILTRRITQN